MYLHLVGLGWIVGGAVFGIFSRYRSKDVVLTSSSADPKRWMAFT